MPITDAQLYTILKDDGYVPEAALISARSDAETTGKSLTEAILQKDLLSDENLGKVVADYLKLPFISLQKIAITQDVLKILPETVAAKQSAIAFELSPSGLKIASSQPQNTEFFKLVAKKVGMPLALYYATDRDLKETLRLYKKELQTSFDELLKHEVAVAAKNQGSNPPVAKIVDLLIEYAYHNKASDIHIEPSEEQSLVRFRIDGVLQDVLKVPVELHDQIVSRIKVLAKLRTDEHLSAQDGKLQVVQPDEEIDVRVSILPIVEGEKVVMRLLASHTRQFGLTDLGMSDADLAKVREAMDKPFGMIMSTGPTGSGKTTSIYSLLKILNTRDKNIATIEDPVEYQIEGINQVQVNPKTNLTFADGLKSILRQDPDIIYVGEIRDEETASIAVNSATTGHLVVSTLHTNDASTAFPRLLDMKVEPFLIASTVNVIVAQRLVRKICDKCRVSFTTTPSELSKQIPKSLIEPAFGAEDEIRLYKGKGCDVCHHTGFVGRIGIFEVLPMSPGIQELINQKADSTAIGDQAQKEGMTTMLEDGLSKVQRGITTVEEVLRATKQ